MLNLTLDDDDEDWVRVQLALLLYDLMREERKSVE